MKIEHQEMSQGRALTSIDEMLARNTVSLYNKKMLTSAYTVGKQTPCKLSFVYTSQVKLTVRTELKFVKIYDAVYVSYFEL